MDNNEFSFDALLDSDEFARYESKETKRFFCAFCEFVENNTKDCIFEDEFHDRISDYGNSVFNDAFKQGFCFAVKSMKFMLKI